MAGYTTLVLFKMTEFFGETDPIHYTAVMKQDLEESLDLEALGFGFAVEEIKPEFGYIVAHQVDWSVAEG